MGATSSILKPQELTDFRKLNTSIENIEIPARPESRSVTDKKGFLFFGIPIIIFLPFFIYGLVKSDIRRWVYDYDSCGNMCGIDNPKIDGIPCSGANYIWADYSNRSLITSPNQKYGCVSHCPPDSVETIIPMTCEPLITPEKVNKNRFPRDTFEHDKKGNFWETLAECKKSWWKFLIVIIITIALSLMMLYLLRYTPAVLVWSILILSVVLAVAATGGLWFAYARANEESKIPLLVGAGAFSIFTLIIVALLLCLFRKIKLVIQLFKEATKAVFAMPLLILIPVLISLVQFIIFVSFVVSIAWLETARVKNKISEDHYEYESNAALSIAVVLEVIMTAWAMEFIAGFQYMTIAGSVATWFFARNKQYLGSPISTSFLNAVKFHTGSIAFGSFILILMAIVRALINSVIDNEKFRCIIDYCCANVEAFLKFLSKNAYIETAIHGQSFLRSGKRAAKLLLSNAGSVIAINSVGDFVLWMIKFIIIIISTGIAITLFKELDSYWFPALICFIFNIVIVAVIFAVFTTTIDTLFICFCEDKEINDGISRPYYMSRGLMEFIENSKKVYEKK